jgi:3-phosphoshikimate 1-carboxyvinyltransferase
MRGVKDLRVKESDRIDAMARGLRACGVSVDEDEDTMTVHGLGAGGVPGGGTCETFLDHRIAMSFMCLGMASEKPVKIDDGGPIATSFPIFEKLMGDLGAQIRRNNR